MKEALFEANEELKRADHLIYVSLKYTRTVDVIKNIIERLINAYDFAIAAILKKLEEEGKITETPPSIVAKCDAVKNYYSNDPKIAENIEFYLLLRQISKAKYERAREYRRHVTMTVEFKDKKMEINIDVIHEYFDKTKNFVEYVRELVKNE